MTWINISVISSFKLQSVTNLPLLFYRMSFIYAKLRTSCTDNLAAAARYLSYWHLLILFTNSLENIKRSTSTQKIIKCIMLPNWVESFPSECQYLLSSFNEMNHVWKQHNWIMFTILKEASVLENVFTARNSCCGRVMFSQPCVHSQGQGRVGIPGPMSRRLSTYPWTYLPQTYPSRSYPLDIPTPIPLRDTDI